MTVSISVSSDESENIVQEAKIKAIKNKVSLSETVIKLLDKWVKGEVEIEGGNGR